MNGMKTETRTGRVERPPGPSTGPARNFLIYRRDPLGTMLSVKERFGDIAYIHAGPFDVYLLSHPDLVREVLVNQSHSFVKSQVLQEAKRVLGEGLLTSEGQLHKRQRRLIQPVFHHARIAGYGQVMGEYADRMAERWTDGMELDAHREMTRLTLAIVGKTLFDTDVEDADARRVGRALADVFDMYEQFLLPFKSVLERLPLPGIRRFQAARRDLDGVVFAMIRERRASGDRGDLLSMLLAARDEEDGHGGMTDQQVRDEAMTIFLAGHETTSIALAWTWYLLSQHPDVESKLHAELDMVLEGRVPTAEDLPALRYTRTVLSESMRLYPPAWAMGRKALADVEIGGYVIPAGATCVMSQYIVHHDRRWYPDQWRFDLDRWTPEAVADRPKFSYFPFGGGSRMCIGEDFAWMEGVLALAAMARRWRLRLVPGQAIALLPRITLRPKHGMRMRLEART